MELLSFCCKRLCPVNFVIRSSGFGFEVNYAEKIFRFDALDIFVSYVQADSTSG